jgi:RimJ/RimL family protein N-acetyltransferase
MLIRSGEVTLQAFEASLTQVLYGIRNHPSVRSRMRDPRPIDPQSHRRWVEDNLVRARTVHLFIVQRRGAPSGIALLRNFRARTAEIGVMMVEARRQRLAAYVAAHLVGYYGFEVLDLERLYSYVPKHNAAALRFNLECGFEPTGTASEVYDELVLTQERSRSHPVHKRFRGTRPIEVVGGSAPQHE